MPAARVFTVLDRLRAAGVPCWVGGGWGVEALVPGPPRPHDDLDLAMPFEALTAATAALEEFGRVHDAEPGMPTRLVLADSQGSQVDLHPLHFEEDSWAWQQLPDGSGDAYSPADLSGHGHLDGVPVACTSREAQLRHHSGYAPDLFDWFDVVRLCRASALPLPEVYAGPPDWIRFGRKDVVRALLGGEPEWTHLDRHRLTLPSGLIEALHRG